MLLIASIIICFPHILFICLGFVCFHHWTHLYSPLTPATDLWLWFDWEKASRKLKKWRPQIENSALIINCEVKQKGARSCFLAARKTQQVFLTGVWLWLPIADVKIANKLRQRLCRAPEWNCGSQMLSYDLWMQRLNSTGAVQWLIARHSAFRLSQASAQAWNVLS